MDTRGPATPADTAALVALLRVGRRAPCIYAARIEEGVSATALLEEEHGLLAPQLVDDAAAEIAGWHEAGIRMLTVHDPGYPENLRAVHDRPPLVFASGRTTRADARSIAVIGSRRASRAGLDRARAIAEHLVDGGYTVVSGLATGIDAAAHRAALDRGGRTVAVIGTGLLHAYPHQNARLQRQIAEDGLVISQFTPETPPAAQNFPKRNAVMSGIALATIVVEAGSKSGARTQVRAALAHGRHVLLSNTLLSQQWARELVRRPGVHAIRAPGELDDLLPQLLATDALVA